MGTIKEEALGYEPKKTKNVADLPEVPTDLQLHLRTGKDKTTGEEYEYNVTSINGEDYRVPDSVLSDLKAILKHKPNLQKFKVEKKGSGLNTSYTVITLD